MKTRAEHPSRRSLFVALAALVALCTLVTASHADEPPAPDCHAEAEAAAREAERVVIADPGQSLSLLQSALECEERGEWRALLGFSLERLGRTCDALAEYERALETTEDFAARRRMLLTLDKYGSQCGD